MTPEEFVSLAEENRCQGASLSFNEPTLLLEWAVELFPLAHRAGLHTNFVTNGYLSEEALEVLVAAGLDGANVDWKGVPEAVRRFCQADLEIVIQNTRRLKEKGVHVEVTTLVIPGGQRQGRRLALSCGAHRRGTRASDPLACDALLSRLPISCAAHAHLHLGTGAKNRRGSRSPFRIRRKRPGSSGPAHLLPRLSGSAFGTRRGHTYRILSSGKRMSALSRSLTDSHAPSPAQIKTPFPKKEGSSLIPDFPESEEDEPGQSSKAQDDPGEAKHHSKLGLLRHLSALADALLESVNPRGKGRKIRT